MLPTQNMNPVGGKTAQSVRDRGSILKARSGLEEPIEEELRPTEQRTSKLMFAEDIAIFEHPESEDEDQDKKANFGEKPK